MTFFICAVALYFLPSILGHKRRDFAGIFIVNFLFGWTVIGWIIALIWACAEPTQPRVLAVAGPVRYCCHCGTPIAGVHFCPACARPL
jgi:hypothetical protein